MKRIIIHKKYIAIWVAILTVQVVFGQFTIPDKPKFQTSLYDYANMLSGSQKTQLENKLIRYSDSTSTQIVVVTVETIKCEDIGILTPKWAHQWGVGQAKEDNGVFVLLAKKERKIWISPGYGVEHKLTAGITGSIVRNTIIPEFKKGDYFAGLNRGSDAIFEVLNANGDTIFAVYPEGVRINVGDGVGKANKGGFAVGGINSGKLGQSEF